MTPNRLNWKKRRFKNVFLYIFLFGGRVSFNVQRPDQEIYEEYLIYDHDACPVTTFIAFCRLGPTA